MSYTCLVRIRQNLDEKTQEKIIFILLSNLKHKRTAYEREIMWCHRLFSNENAIRGHCESITINSKKGCQLVGLRNRLKSCHPNFPNAEQDYAKDMTSLVVRIIFWLLKLRKLFLIQYIRFISTRHLIWQWAHLLLLKPKTLYFWIPDFQNIT